MEPSTLTHDDTSAPPRQEDAFLLLSSTYGFQALRTLQQQPERFTPSLMQGRQELEYMETSWSGVRGHLAV